MFNWLKRRFNKKQQQLVSNVSKRVRTPGVPVVRVPSTSRSSYAPAVHDPGPDFVTPILLAEALSSHSAYTPIPTTTTYSGFGGGESGGGGGGASWDSPSSSSSYDSSSSSDGGSCDGGSCGGGD